MCLFFGLPRELSSGSLLTGIAAQREGTIRCRVLPHARMLRSADAVCV